MKITHSLSAKTSFGYVIIIVIALITSLICFFILQKNKKIDMEITNTYTPSINLYKDADGTVLEMKRLLNSWIYTPNKPDKDKLLSYTKVEFPNLKRALLSLANQTSNEDIRKNITLVVQKLDIINSRAIAMTGILATDDDYADDVKVDNALTTYDKNIVPEIDKLDAALKKTNTDIILRLIEIQTEKESSFIMLNSAFGIMIIFILLAGWFSFYLNNRLIIKPLNEFKNIIGAISKGEIAEVNTVVTEDEIGEMTVSIKNMLTGIKSNTNFAVEIGKGNYESSFTPLSDKDVMGNALIEMRDNLKESAEEEHKRNWVTNGLAKIGDILRKTDVSSDQLYNDTLKFVIKYSGANQGGIFIINDLDPDNLYIDLVACYAYEKKKFLEKRLEMGEGLVGQCILEKEKIFMTDVPESYIEITSGLGTGSPRSIILIPLKVNEVVQGVIEVASFKVFQNFEIEFIEKIAESIASTISTVKINDRTKKLLEDSQQQGEQLRSQEEEMRQNMEELQATQEEVYRKEQSYLEEIESLKEKLARLESVGALV